MPLVQLGSKPFDLIAVDVSSFGTSHAGLAPLRRDHGLGHPGRGCAGKGVAAVASVGHHFLAPTRNCRVGAGLPQQPYGLLRP